MLGVELLIHCVLFEFADFFFFFNFQGNLLYVPKTSPVTLMGVLLRGHQSCWFPMAAEQIAANLVQ